MSNILNIQNLCCGYPKFQLLDINIDIPKGSFAGIIGPNGSGKTTLFRAITGTLGLKSGKILLSDKNLKSFSLRDRAQNIAIVSQFIEAGDMTVEDYVLMGRIPYHSRFNFFETDDDFEIARKYMEMTDTWRFKDQLMSELSGGEQQLAGIARALTQQPQLLLLDEPTSHLDITHQVHILNVLQQLNQEMGLSVLMVIHDLNLASEYCDWLILVNQGKIHTQGTPEEVLTFQNIEDVYQTVVVTQNNPLSGKPAIFLASQKVLKEIQEKLAKK
ncbi:vitamin B12 ABC transporter, ATPase component BtuD [Aquipluma nitroreducens]|uniref:Vitamin B12 ABC transporter, ATPase component BtuD n=1 Tax=Aquipluma nitroreducens TaxID=2010828 RepID=A0A5K7SA34_9BACT|nr:ABC transporter ATP-binding protein [Aquipluma nitroreducens]BBE18307.1 vitamin B12 ABC transporter, ATPase component BtuD [Aquipluma nitroreducens]